MNNPIDEITNAILTRIKDAVKRKILGYSLPLVAPYGGEIDDDALRHVLKTRTPAVWVTFHGENDPGRIGGRRDNAAYFDIVICVRNAAGEKSSYLGSKTAVGANQIITDIKGLLSDQNLGLKIEPLEFQETQPVYKGHNAGYYTTIYYMRFKTRYQQPTAQKTYEDLDEFLRLNSTWTVKKQTSQFNINVRSQTKND